MPLRRIKVSYIFTLGVGAILIAFAIGSLSWIHQELHEQALAEAKAKARILLDRNVVTHEYFTAQLKPSLYGIVKDLMAQGYFEPKWMSSTYAVREQQKLFNKLNLKKYYYKEVAINARSPENEADKFERKIFDRFMSDPKMEEWSGIRQLSDGPYFTLIRRSESMSKACLRCHSDPSQAPKGLIQKYGDVRSFHRALGELTSLASIRIPLDQAYAQADLTTQKFAIGFAAMIFAVFLMLFFLNHKIFARPLQIVRDEALEITTGRLDLGHQIKARLPGEWQDLAVAFNTMSGELKKERETLEQRVDEATAALKASESRFSTLFKSSPIWMALNRFDDGTYLDVNEAFSQVTGFSRDEALGHTSAQIGLWDPDNDRERFVDELRRQGHFDGREAVFYDKDGKPIYTLWSARRVEINGQPCVLNTLVDITPQKKADEEREKIAEQLRQSQKMEAIGTLAGGVAHDFNNILSAVIGYTELTIEDLPTSSPLRENLNQVLQSSWRARNLVSQLLAFSRKQVLEIKTFPLNDLIKHNQAMLSRIIGEDIELKVALAPDAGFVEADFNQIEQVLLNLVANARDAMPDGGKLTIETANVDLDDDYASRHPDAESGPYVMLAVSDNGPGIDPRHKKHIFDPFFTTKETGKGTGMGLATVHGIVKQHLGNIYLYSEVGIGTTFKVYLPRAERAADILTERVQIADMRGGNEVILLVEDEQAVRHFIVKTLTKLGYEVTEAGNGPAAIDLMKEADYEIDLLLTDVVMPQMNGKTLYQNLSADRPQLKVLYISGYTDNVIAHHGVLDGVAFLQKPLSIVSLANKIREVLDA